jgi:HPt (histidine-containing phosphotransfer) domain-containing protein
MRFDTFDVEEVLREFGDEHTAAELAAIVRADVTAYAAALQEAAAADDLARVREVAHAVKGAAGTVAAGPVCELASRIDTGLRRGETAVAQFAPALVAECGRLAVDLGTWLGALQAPAPTTR